MIPQLFKDLNILVSIYLAPLMEALGEKLVYPLANAFLEYPQTISTVLR